MTSFVLNLVRLVTGIMRYKISRLLAGRPFTIAPIGIVCPMSD